MYVGFVYFDTLCTIYYCMQITMRTLNYFSVLIFVQNGCSNPFLEFINMRVMAHDLINILKKRDIKKLFNC